MAMTKMTQTDKARLKYTVYALYFHDVFILNFHFSLKIVFFTVLSVASYASMEYEFVDWWQATAGRDKKSI